jgi:indole-3-glycerol phosphate synthase
MSSSLLGEIFAHKRQEVAAARAENPLERVQDSAKRVAPAQDLPAALRQASAPGRPALIAEVKFASPSRGILLAEADPLHLASIYQENGAAGISVLTDEHYFHGSLEYLAQIARQPQHLPLLRKDFICDPYQVYEARQAGADAILLIVAGLLPDQLWSLHELANELGMSALVEVHSLVEIKIALGCNPKIIGINNRDLRDFSVNLNTTRELRPHIPPGIVVVAESGIHTRNDVLILGEIGVDAVLVGEALVTASDIAAQVRELSLQEISV